MGMRGPGARKKPVVKPKRRYPWNKRGLSRVERVVAFLEWLPITKGICQGEKMRLLPSQREFVENVYGTKRQVRIAVLSEPRGNGKTGLLSGIALCHLLGPESEPRGEVYSAAIDRGQAALLFAEMEAVIRAVPDFEARTNVIRFHKKIEVLHGEGEGSIYESLSADARRAHGLAPSLWVYDEMAQAKSRELLDNLTTAMGKRKRSLGMVISTQTPRDDHALSRLIDDGLAGLDRSLYVQLICAPPEADPYSEETVRACNPAVDKFLKLDDLMLEAEQAKRMPDFERRFRNLRLNQRTAMEGSLVSPAVWKACGREPWPEAFKSGKVRVGLDLSARNDLTAIVCVAEWQGEKHVLADFFAPAGGISERSKRDHAQYDTWADMGYITLTEGSSVDYESVARRLVEICDDYNVEVIMFDRWRMDVLETELQRLGVTLPMAPFGQGWKDMSPAIDTLESDLLNGRVRHGNNPVLTMCVTNAVVVSDDAGNRKFTKRKSTARIDGAVALAMGSAVMHTEPPPSYSVFFA